MAITASGLYVQTFMDVLDTTQLALDLDLETHKIALFNTLTPNFQTDTAYGVAPYNANEITGTNWAAGGVALTGTGLTNQSGSLVWDAADVSVASTTIATDPEGGLIYADALAGNNAIAMIYFGAGDFTTNNGTFAITWAAPASGGVFAIDLTP
jgi:hypothetical protein